MYQTQLQRDIAALYAIKQRLLKSDDPDPDPKMLAALDKAYSAVARAIEAMEAVEEAVDPEET